jgi:type II secretory pathway component PulF
LLFAFGLFAFASLIVVPQFEETFNAFQMRLPLTTQWLLLVGRIPIGAILAPVLVLAVVIVLIGFVLRRTEHGRQRWARLLYVVPIFGTILRASRLAAFSDLLSILVEHEVPLPEAFSLAGAASSDPIMAGAVRRIEEDLKQGQPLGKALQGRGLIPEWVGWMISLGERRGTLGKTLHQVADTYRRQVEVRAAILKSFLPPLLIILVAGLFASFFVVALIAPMVKLLEALSK